MRLTLAFAAGALLALPLLAQTPHVRPPVQLDPGTTGFGLGPSLSSDSETTAVLYNDGGTGGANHVYVVLADGRALTWAAPLQVDSDTSGKAKFTQWDSCWVFGSNIYAAWRDDRNDNPSTSSITENDMFVNVSNDGGTTWAGEVLVAKGYPPGTASRTIRDYAVYVHDNGTAVGSDDHVYVLQSVEGPTGGNEELYLASSHDGGATWSAAVPVSANPLGAADVDFIALGANGMHVSVAWQDNRNGGTSFDDVWFQHSHDGGITWQAADTKLNDTSTVQGDAEFEMNMAVSGSTIVVAWQEERASTSNEEIQVNVSLDNGMTWNGDVQVGGYGSSVDVDFGNGGLALVNGLILVVWNDHRNGPTTGDDDVFVSVSADNGATWSSEVEISSPNGGGFATFGRPRAGQDVVVATWSTDVFPNTAESSFSRDGGATWIPGGAFDVGLNPAPDVDFAEIAFNTRYNNAICAFLRDDIGANRVFGGGYRPQTLTVNGPLAAGQPVNFSVTNWPSADTGYVFGVLAALATGAHVLPDGRATGLASDAVLAKCLQIIQSEFLSGSVPGMLTGVASAGGSGSTSVVPFPNKFAPGTPLYFTAVAFDAPPLTLGSITDVENETVQ